MVYINHLLEDLRSLEYMLNNNMIETGVVRLGAEQEFCLVGDCWRPALNAKAVLENIDDSHFTTELAQYNLEINLDPFAGNGSVFQKIREQLNSLLQKARIAAEAENSKIVLSGILPSVSMNEIGLQSITNEPRYHALNETLLESRGDDFKLQISGVDELSMTHDTVMFEACNTSFQMHLQIDPEDFESSYNWAQAISGPVLAACVNSPLLLGKELWHETRIALFQQSIDTRTLTRANIDRQARVSFGEDWVRGSILDHYKSEISKFHILLTKEIENNSFEELRKGQIPKLKALNLHNGTVYRWNRPCYGVGGGKAHVRIENRYIPSGPSVEDEIANMVFWVGLMSGRTKKYEHLWEKMDFQDVRDNFQRAAKYGSDAIMIWNGRKRLVKDLILKELMPLCENGLKKLEIDSSDIKHYLNIILHRLETQTGSQWTVKNFRNLKQKYGQDHALLTVTKAMHDNQIKDIPVGEWPDIASHERVKHQPADIGHIMSTSLITARETDSARLTMEFMRWNNIHHLPIIDNQNTLVGLITWSHLEQYQQAMQDPTNLLCAGDIMVTEVETVATNTPIAEAISKAKKLNIGCLPVLQNDKLVGIVTHRDLNRIGNAGSVS